MKELYLNNEELAWAAGFVDGEGHFGLHLSGRSITARKYGVISLNIAQKDRQVLDKFQEIVGLGKVYGPYSHGKKPTKYFGYFIHNFEHTQAAIGYLWKWLSPVKREQAKQTLIQYSEYLKRPSWRANVRGKRGPYKIKAKA